MLPLQQATHAKFEFGDPRSLLALEPVECDPENAEAEHIPETLRREVVLGDPIRASEQEQREPALAFVEQKCAEDPGEQDRVEDLKKEFSPRRVHQWSADPTDLVDPGSQCKEARPDPIYGHGLSQPVVRRDVVSVCGVLVCPSESRLQEDYWRRTVQHDDERTEVQRHPVA